ncbi:MAG: hypothetical protein M1834_005799 [Cirrosporium novae-zelandiae]|nr:MAG: hypothetical protein M1834_005799 [Cirrosporium novae-zelandiae]
MAADASDVKEKGSANGQDSSHGSQDLDGDVTLDGSVDGQPQELSPSDHTDAVEAPRTYDPITSHDRLELTRIASSFSIERKSLERTNSLERTKSRVSSHKFKEEPEPDPDDTLNGLDSDDPVLDPNSPQFDVYKWACMFVKTLADEGRHTRKTGLVFKNLNVTGSGKSMFIQHNVATILGTAAELRHLSKRPQKRILRDFNGVIKSGEMLVVLGRPGSGCSTFLKTLCGEHHGLKLGEDTVLHYNGIPMDVMIKHFKGDIVYNGETDKHFPHLTVRQTLEFAAAVRTPHNRPGGVSRKFMIDHFVDVILAVLGLTHTRNTKVGNAYIRGVSGGERKRVSIAEMALSRAPLAAWDNSSRGLDSATALEFIRALRITADVAGMTHAVAIYQASQAIYDRFEKATVLYEGRQIYFGPANKAKQYFEKMGWYCPERQTVGDFLTSVTNPMERHPRDGYEKRVPRTPDDFERYWKKSEEYHEMLKEIDDYEKDFPVGGSTLEEFQKSYRDMQANHTRAGTPYMISIPMQVKLCFIRTYQRILGDSTSTITRIIGQICMSLIVGSIFWNNPNTTAGLFGKGAVTFFAVLLNALIAVVEIFRLYEQRPIVEKQASYAFYRPFTEALGSWLAEIPIKTVAALAFNTVLYFMANLRREPSQFFIFMLFNWISTITMQVIFRTIGSVTNTVDTAMALAGIVMLALIIFTGFVIPPSYMHPWFKWINYINPIGYSYESILANEAHGRNFTCASDAIVPAYSNVTGTQFICSKPGAVAGEFFVNGDKWMDAAYEYKYSHVWRNFGIIIGFTIFFLFTYLLASEFNSLNLSKPDVLVFRRGHVPKHIQEAEKVDEIARVETTDEELVKLHTRDEGIQQEEIDAIPPQKDIFTWNNVCYDISIKGKKKRLLRDVDGWVAPGTLTALMGASGAGKTTLLDVLAQRKTVGVVTGDMFVNGKPLDESFPRKTGYVQQLDLHLETTTVREALRFSAMLRQPRTVSKEEKYNYCEDVIRMLRMEDFAEAVVGIPGEGLNVEQRKLLTIGVELAAKPQLLLFLDEPTSGLDSQSSWSIISFLRRLADHGQAVLATIHQPSAILFQQFDRLLLLTEGGRTVYFGDIGENSRTMINYFEKHGARACGAAENPAEYMLEAVGSGAGGHTDQDWHQVWKSSEEYQGVQAEIQRIHREKRDENVASDGVDTEFAMPMSSQLYYVIGRVFEQYWRTPYYIYGKYLLGVVSALFNGFSFYQSDNSEQGLQDVLFAVFMLTATFSSQVHQIMPRFVIQRELYEVRERPSKAYSWKAFLAANIFVEIPFQILLGIMVWASFYYPVFGIQSADRQGLSLLYCIEFYIYTSTFAHLLIASMPDEETAGIVCTLMFAMSLVFNGIMQPPDALPGFWMFMYRVSPFTYWVDGIVATGLHGREIECSSHEMSVFNPPQGATCGQYMAEYLKVAPGTLYNPEATSSCEYCTVSVADTLLAQDRIYWSDRWRNWGLVWAYVIFDIAGAVLTYYIFRVKNHSMASLKNGLKKMFSGSKSSKEKAVQSAVEEKTDSSEEKV